MIYTTSTDNSATRSLGQNALEAYGIAILIAEDEEGHYEVVGPVSTIEEAAEIAGSDMATRMGLLESDEDPGLCPAVYKLWSRNSDGQYRVVREIQSQI